jgi:DNA-binding response OmpR family regulator
MIAQHGGRIYAISPPGKGATFVVELPILENQDKTDSASPTVEPQVVSEGKILVVDDEPSVLEFLTHVLTEEGHKVDTASNGTTALEKITAEEYDLVLLDVRLPQIGGIEVYYSIERMSRRLARKVVLITADTNGADTQSFLERTGAKHLAKPFDTNAVKRVVNSVVQET